jgi:hypothetical protein
LLPAIPMLAQSSAAYGTRIGQMQTVYLEDLPQGVLNALDISDRFREIVGAVRVAGASGVTFTPPPPVDKGPRAEFETWVEHLSRDYAESVVTAVSSLEREAGKATVHRTVRDNFRHLDLAYNLTFEAIPGTRTFRVTFGDSDVPHPAPQILRDGETIALALSPEPGGRRMSDYIRVGLAAMKARQGVARDVYADDAELNIAQPHLRINGTEQQPGNVPAMLSAPVVAVGIPGQGRYLLSFKPHASQGFERAGEVTGSALMFTMAGNVFRLDSAERVATGSGTYNIYVRREAGEAPDSPGFSIGAADLP